MSFKGPLLNTRIPKPTVSASSRYSGSWLITPMLPVMVLEPAKTSSAAMAR